MTDRKKFKIEIRRVKHPGIKVSAREKSVYFCRSCSNRYYAFHYFCPQCLGYTCRANPSAACLALISIPEEKQSGFIDLLKLLTAKKDFEYQRALRTLPWTIFENGDRAVLEEWQQVLETEHAELRITEYQPVKSGAKRSRSRKLLFSSEPPLPRYFQGNLGFAVRDTAQAIRDGAVRLQWAETVLLAFRIIEGFYKQDPAGRILFSDLIYHMEQDLHEAIREFKGYYKYHEDEFAQLLEGVQSAISEKQMEIQDIKNRVRERL